jgi:hypothetical protein
MFIRNYKCPKCEHAYSVGFWKWLCAPHMFDIWRWMKCPACGKRSWIKKIKE